jgi:hypothetical protein
MKHFIAIIILIFLMGCGVANNVAVGEDKHYYQGMLDSTGKNSTRIVEILTDSETGCQYLTYDRGISPRYDSHGQVIGCKEIAKGNKQ